MKLLASLNNSHLKSITNCGSRFKKRPYIFTVITLILTSQCYSQTKSFAGSQKSLEKNYYQKIVTNKGENIIASVDSIYVDTLILRDESTIQFQLNSILIIENAFVGHHCTLKASGTDADNFGISGTDGSSLYCIIVFKELGSLIIDTRGGNGMRGFRGLDGKDGMNGGRGSANGLNGETGKPGGNGGNGGNLKLAYLCDGFTPIFNGGDQPHSVNIFLNGGNPGEGGKGGKGGRRGQESISLQYGRPGRDGVDGNAGNRGNDGILTIKEIK